MSTGIDQDRTTQTLEELLSSELGEPVRVDRVQRRPSEFATLSAAEVLSVLLGDGRELRLFLKHLGPEQSDQPDKQRRDREVRVYEDLLRGNSGLPVPRYFGARWNAATHRHELYLQHVDDWNLRYHGLTHWFTAAARLADLHGHFARDGRKLLECDFLLRLDETYFQAWAERAVAAIRALESSLGQRLGRIAGEYGSAARLLATQPPTLVHNDLAPKNVIAARDGATAQIFIVDWEMAGVGCGLLDLVHLKFGLDPLNEERMVSAYCNQLHSAGLLPTDEQEFSRLLAACELHKTLYRLAHCPKWQLPLHRISGWVDEAEEFLRAARGTRP